MEIVTMDKRGRLTLPAQTRERLRSDRLLVIPEGDTVRLIPLLPPEKVKGSIKIPWSIAELEEAGEKFVEKRVEG